MGEIQVRGPFITGGYYAVGSPSDKFTPDGWLRTGDLGRWDNGFIVMADRAKEMIIQGGFNIYPSQVEKVLKAMPGVRDVAVVGIPDAARGESVVAALVLEPDTTVDLDMVRRWAYDKLSHYAVPRSIAILEDLPRSQIGKVMRRSVREQLEDFELIAGQWRKKASSTTEVASDRWEAFTASLQEQFNATIEQVQDWLTELGKSTEQVRDLFNRAGTDDESEELSRQGFSLEAFSAWLARGHKEKNSANANEADSDSAEGGSSIVEETHSPEGISS